MASKKLSIYLKRFYLPEHIESEDPINIVNLAIDFTNDYKEKIFQQPKQAKRAIVVEMQDIYNHFKEYEKYIHVKNAEMNAMHDKYGTHFGEKALFRLRVLEEHRNLWAEWANCIHDALGYMTRLLLEHYSEEELGVAFLEKFAEYMGPFDWMSKRAKHFIDKLSKDKEPMEEPKLDIEYTKNWREEFELSDFLMPLYGYEYTGVNQDLLDYVRSKGYEGQQCSHKDKLCENCIGSWLMNQYRAKLVQEANPFPSYKHKLDFILKNIKLLHLDTTSILVDGEYFSSTPKTDEEIIIYSQVWWEYNRKKIIHDRSKGKQEISDLPVVTLDELKLKLRGVLRSSPKPEEVVKRELERVNSLFDNEKKIYQKRSYDYHYQRILYSEPVSFVPGPDLMENYIRFDIGALIEHYVSYRFFLDSINIPVFLQECLPFEQSISMVMDKEYKFCCTSTEQTFLKYVEEGLSNEHLDLVYSGLMDHPFDNFRGEHFGDNKDQAIKDTVDKLFAHVSHFNDLDFEKRFTKEVLDLVNTRHKGSYATQKALFRKHFNAKFRAEYEHVNHATIIHSEKIKTTLNVEELAIFLRVLRDSNIIAKDISANKLPILVSAMFSSKDKDEVSANSLAKKYYSKNTITMRNVASIIKKMDNTIEDMINKSES